MPASVLIPTQQQRENIMKYLSDYMNDKQTKAFEQYGAFFALSNKQMEEKRVEGVKYASLGAGLIAPTDNAEKLINSLETIRSESIKQDIDENGIKAIIHRELGNHECQITCDYSDVVDVLDPYGVTVEQIKAEYSIFFQNCIDNDYF